MPWNPTPSRVLVDPIHSTVAQFTHKRGVLLNLHTDLKHGSLNVPIEHHPTIRYMVYNGYYKVMSNIPKMGQLPTPVKGMMWISSCPFDGNISPISLWCGFDFGNDFDSCFFSQKVSVRKKIGGWSWFTNVYHVYLIFGQSH